MIFRAFKGLSHFCPRFFVHEGKRGLQLSTNFPPIAIGGHPVQSYLLTGQANFIFSRIGLRAGRVLRVNWCNSWIKVVSGLLFSM